MNIPSDGVPRLKLITLSNHQITSSDDPEQYISPDEDYMLTIEELSSRTEEVCNRISDTINAGSDD